MKKNTHADLDSDNKRALIENIKQKKCKIFSNFDFCFLNNKSDNEIIEKIAKNPPKELGFKKTELGRMLYCINSFIAIDDIKMVINPRIFNKLYILFFSKYC